MKPEDLGMKPRFARAGTGPYVAPIRKTRHGDVTLSGPRHFEKRDVKRAFPSYEKSTHEEAFEHFVRERRSLEARYRKAVAEAEKKYGTHGPLVSGIVRGHFPDIIKNKLRSLSRKIGAAIDAAYAHHVATGRRTSFSIMAEKVR